jgi:GTP-binding protein EngB required for normal cell division
LKKRVIGEIEMPSARLRELRESDNTHQYCLRSPGIRPLLSIVAAAESIAKRNGSKKLRWQLQDLRDRIVLDQFRIAIVGQFKRGKTSLLNALLGEAGLLPVGTLPFTSILTMVRQGSQKTADVIFRSGACRPVPLGELKDYVTEAGNPDNEKLVEHVEVFCAADILDNGVCFVNSPGFGSLSEKNTQTAYDYLPRIDAAIFVTSPEPPLTAGEMDFLRKLMSTTKKVFLVMSKVDVLDANAVGQVLRFTEKAMARLAPDASPKIYPVSALPAATPPLDYTPLDGIHRLEADIREFLAAEQNETFQCSVSQCLSASLFELRAELESGMASAQEIVQGLENKRMEFKEEVRIAYNDHAHNENLFADAVNRLGELAENELLRFAESKRFDLDTPIRAFLRGSDRIPKQHLARALNDFTILQINNLFDAWSREFEASLVRTVADTGERFVQSANSVIAAFRARVSQHFGSEMEDERITEAFPSLANRQHLGPAEAPPKPYPALSLIPRALLRHWMLHETTGTFRRRLQSTSQLVARELRERLRAAVRSFTDAVRRALEHGIERLLGAVFEAQEQHHTSVAFHKQHMAQLSEDVRTIDQLTAALKAPAGFQFALEA